MNRFLSFPKLNAVITPAAVIHPHTAVADQNNGGQSGSNGQYSIPGYGNNGGSNSLEQFFGYGN